MPTINTTPKQDKNTETFSLAVAELIKKLVDKTTHLEDEKIDLFQNHMFSPYVAFNYIDFYGQGYVTKKDFESLLSKNGITCSPNALTYLLFVKSQKASFKESKTPSLRSDVLSYDEFLSIIRPKNSKVFLSKFNSLDGKYEGKERLLPKYVFNQLMGIIKDEVDKFEDIEKAKSRMVNKYGYFANTAWSQLVQLNQGSLTLDQRDPHFLETQLGFPQIQNFMHLHGYDLTEDQFNVLVGEIDCDHNGTISRGEFLDLLTPFSEFLVANVGDRRYDNLSKLQNKKLFDGYMKNGFMYSPEKEPFQLDNKAHKMVPEMLKGIYTEKFKDPKHPVNRNLYVDENYKVNYNIRKKKIDPTMTRGFNDYYNNYFKTLCHDERNQAVELARKVTKDRLSGFQYLNGPSTVNVRPQKTQTSTMGGLLGKFSRSEYKNQGLNHSTKRAIDPRIQVETQTYASRFDSILKGHKGTGLTHPEDRQMYQTPTENGYEALNNFVAKDTPERESEQDFFSYDLASKGN